MFFFDSLFPIVSGKPFDLEMAMRKSVVKLGPMHGYKKIVQMCQFRTCMVLLCLQAKLYVLSLHSIRVLTI